MHHPGFDALPLGSSVLEPDLDLYLAEAQLTRDHRALGQRQVFLAVELFLQLKQLVAGERRAAPSMSAAARTRTCRRGLGGRHGLGVIQRVILMTVNVDDAVVGR